MKAQDLMIGDWVEVNNTALQIAALGTAKAGFIDAKGEMFYHYYDNIEPIPLTIEILEQNGFKFNDGMFNWFRSDEDSYYTAFESVRIDVRSGFMRVLKEYKDGKQKEVRCDCSGYVHELQHALRLQGIKKDIKL